MRPRCALPVLTLVLLSLAFVAAPAAAGGRHGLQSGPSSRHHSPHDRHASRAAERHERLRQHRSRQHRVRHRRERARHALDARTLCLLRARIAAALWRGWGPLWRSARHPGRRHRHHGRHDRHHRHGWLPGPPPVFRCDEPRADEPVEGQGAVLLLDASGAPVAEAGELALDDAGVRLALQTSFTDPVVVTGPPTRRAGDPGVVRLSEVSGSGFRAAFREWSYLDGEHAEESVHYLAVERGVHEMPDGSVWEAGTLDAADTQVWSSGTFTAAFASAPRLFLSAQTRADEAPVTVRAREVSASGFQAALFEEEGGAAGHAAERLGYLAIASPERSGRLATGADPVPYLLRRVAADHRRLPVLSHVLRLEEEGSADDETAHPDEGLDVLALGARLFAQDVTGGDPDTAALRREAPEHEALLEWGTLPELDHRWQTVPLARSYTSPVVVVRPLSSEGKDPGVVRVRNATGGSFDARVQEWSYLSEEHVPERAFYLVVESGITSVAGLVVEAGRLETDRVMADGPEAVPFSAPFPAAPGVFASVMTRNGPEPVTVRIGERSAQGFSVAMQEEEADAGSGHALETLGWVAVQAGRGVASGERRLAVLEARGDHSGVHVDFGETLRGRFPVLVGQVSSSLGADPVELRYRGLAPDAAELVLEEERSDDFETAHAAEDLSVLVAE